MIAEPNSRVRRGLLLAGVAVVLFALSLPFTKVALQGYDFVTVSLGRAAIAGVVAVVALLVTRVPRPPRTLVRPLVLTALGGIVGFPVLTTVALESTTSAHAAVVIALLPIATAVIGVRRTDERPAVLFWVAASLGTAVVMLYAVARGGGADGGLLPDSLLLLAVGCAAYGYVEGAVLTRSMPGWQVASWVLVVMLPITVPATLVALWVHRAGFDPSPAATAALLYQALVVAYAAYFLWYLGLGLAGVTRASQLQNLQPLLTVGASALLLGEAVPAGTWIAAVAVLAAVVVTQWSRRQDRREVEGVAGPRP